MKEVFMWLGIIVIAFITIMAISCCYAASLADEKMELERPDFLDIKEDKYVR